MKIFGINILHAIHSIYYGRILQKTMLYFGFKNPDKKIRETRKLEIIYSWIAFCKKTGKTRVDNQTKPRIWEDSVYAQKLKNAVQEFHLSRSVEHSSFVPLKCVVKTCTLLHVFTSIIVHCEQYTEQFYNYKSLFVSICL
jgi:hypothetical protein